MANLSKDSKEKLEQLNGCEVYSLNYEGTVSIINGNEVWSRGEKVDTLNTNEKIQNLFEEYFENEFGGTEFYY